MPRPQYRRSPDYSADSVGRADGPVLPRHPQFHARKQLMTKSPGRHSLLPTWDLVLNTGTATDAKSRISRVPYPKKRSAISLYPLPIMHHDAKQILATHSTAVCRNLTQPLEAGEGHLGLGLPDGCHVTIRRAVWARRSRGHRDGRRRRSR